MRIIEEAHAPMVPVPTPLLMIKYCICSKHKINCRLSRLIADFSQLVLVIMRFQIIGLCYEFYPGLQDHLRNA